jgi:hypothetical protein
VPSIVPFGTLGAEKLEVGLVHERRRLERVAGTDASELTMRQRSQFGVDDWKQPIERVAIPFADRNQHLGDLSRIWRCLVGACHRLPFTRFRQQ